MKHPKTKTPHPSSFSRKQLLIFALGFALIGGYLIFRTFAATTDTANLWVDLNGGSCTRQSTPTTYADSQACSTFDAAWDAANSGDTIRVKAGTYPTQKTTGNKTAETKIIGEDGTTVSGTQECRPEFGADAAFCTEAAFLTLENIIIDSNTTSGIGSCSRIWTGANNVKWKNIKCFGDHPFVYVEGSNFTWQGGDLGEDDDGLPRITCTSGGGEPLWLQDGADGAVIDGVRFHKRLIQASPTPNQGTCGADGLPHLETIRFENADNVTIKNSRFDNGSDAGSGHIFSSQDVDNLTLINNYWGPVNGTYWVQANNSGNSNWTMLYNTFTQGSSMTSSGQLWVGNYGYNQGCSGSQIKNVWQGSGSCGTNTYIGSQSLGLDSSGRLSSSSPAIDAAESNTAADYCTAAVGSIDFDGDARPSGSACDAGADEYDGTVTSPPASGLADLNSDGKVGIADLAILLSKWNTSDQTADINNDGTVNVLDFSILLSNYGKSYSSGGDNSCAVSTLHVPDGPDGMGGCWPGPSNTGVPAGVALTTYTGPCTITAANTVIDAKNIQCDELLIRANNVTISRSRIKTAVHGMGSSGYAFTISDSEIDGAMDDFGGVACVNCGVDGYNFTILRTEILHTNRSAFCENTCDIRDSWFHGVNLDTSPCPQASSGTCPHASAVRAQQNMTLTHNALSCDFTGPFNDDLGCSADMSGYPDFTPIKNNTIDSNLFMANNVGVGFCAYGGATGSKPYSSDPTNATNIVFKNNVFQRGPNGKCGSYGPITDFDGSRNGNVWTNNKYDNGATVNPD